MLKLSLLNTVLFFVFLDGAQAGPKPYASPFNQNKVQFSKSFKAQWLSPDGSREKAAKSTLPAGTELAVIINTSCAKDAYFKNKKGEALLNVEVKPWRLKKKYSLAELEKSIEDDACILGVSENQSLRLASAWNGDPRFEEQVALKAINAPRSYDLFWGSTARINSEVTVAVLDTGIDYTHGDLKNRMWRSEGGGFGVNLVSSSSDNPMDDNGHGTHCAGLIGAESSNGLGISGIMGFRLKLMAVKVLDSQGKGDLITVASGLRYAADQGAEVINISLGGPIESAVLEDALKYAVSKGALVVVASGNQGELISSTNFYSPIGYTPQIQGALGVGSVDAITGRKSSFSNYSKEFVEIASPGSAGLDKILSTWLNQAYHSEQGTSVSAPIVSGAAALSIAFLKTHKGGFSPGEVEEILVNSSYKDKALEPYFKKGARLDLSLLSRYLQSLVLFEGHGALEDGT